MLLWAIWTSLSMDLNRSLEKLWDVLDRKYWFRARHANEFHFSAKQTCVRITINQFREPIIWLAMLAWPAVPLRRHQEFWSLVLHENEKTAKALCAGASNFAFPMHYCHTPTETADSCGQDLQINPRCSLLTELCLNHFGYNTTCATDKNKRRRYCCRALRIPSLCYADMTEENRHNILLTSPCKAIDNPSKEFHPYWWTTTHRAHRIRQAVLR